MPLVEMSNNLDTTPSSSTVTAALSNMQSLITGVNQGENLWLAEYYTGYNFDTFSYEREEDGIHKKTEDADLYAGDITSAPYFGVDWNLQNGIDVFNDDFSVRWTRNLTFGQTGTYTIFLFLSGGSRIYIDGVLEDDFWNPANGTQFGQRPPTGLNYMFNAGQVYEIVIEYQSKAIFTTPPERWAIATIEGGTFNIDRTLLDSQFLSEVDNGSGSFVQGSLSLAPLQMAGQSNGSSAVEAALSRVSKMTGTSAGESSVEGTLGRITPFSGTSNGESSVSAEGHVIRLQTVEAEFSYVPVEAELSVTEVTAEFTTTDISAEFTQIYVSAEINQINVTGTFSELHTDY